MWRPTDICKLPNEARSHHVSQLIFVAGPWDPGLALLRSIICEGMVNRTNRKYTVLFYEGTVDGSETSGMPTNWHFIEKSIKASAVVLAVCLFKESICFEFLQKHTARTTSLDPVSSEVVLAVCFCRESICFEFLQKHTARTTSLDPVSSEVVLVVCFCRESICFEFLQKQFAENRFVLSFCKNTAKPHC